MSYAKFTVSLGMLTFSDCGELEPLREALDKFVRQELENSPLYGDWRSPNDFEVELTEHSGKCSLHNDKS